MRGAFVPVLAEEKKQSCFELRASPFQPVRRWCRATPPTCSWHMFELSGGLLQPYERASSAYMYEVSSAARCMNTTRFDRS